MDFGGELFWVILLIFYLVFQVLGARKKTQQQQKRRAAGPPVERPSAEPRESNELDEALSEIRRALGYPDERREEPTPPVSETQTVERPLEGLSARDEPSRMPPARKEPLKTRSLRDEPSRLPPGRRTPLEGRSVRNEPSRIPPVRREPPKPHVMERRTSMRGGSIYAAEGKKGAFGREDAFEKLDQRQPAPAPARTSSLPAFTASDQEQKPRLSAIVKRLQSAPSAREAVLMKEILDRPRAFRHRR